MGGKVIDGLVYSLCDALGMNMDIDPKTLVVAGSMSRKIKVGQLDMEIPMKVVASQIDDKGYMLMIRSKGNLAILITAKSAKQFDAMTFDLLNVAKMGNACAAFFERFPAPVSPAEARADLGNAIVKGFKKISRNEWAEA